MKVVDLVDTDVHGFPPRPARFACEIPPASRAMIEYKRLAADLDLARTIAYPKMGLESHVFHKVELRT